jgi:YHS domain-containing protein
MEEATHHLDPVCGQPLEGERSHLSTEYKRRRYYFCSEKCQQAFERQAERFRLGDMARAGALLTPGKVRWGIA